MGTSSFGADVLFVVMVDLLDDGGTDTDADADEVDGGDKDGVAVAGLV